MPTSIVAAATPKISATRSPLLPPSVMVLPSVAHIAPLLVCLVCLLFVACTETTAPVRRYPVLDDIGNGPWGTVTVGGDHTCALQQSGDAYCWGSNQSGQLGIDRLDTLCGSGDAHFGCSTSPQQVQPGLRFIQISAGARHTCAIATTRDAYCWGASDQGQVNEFTIGGATLVRIAGSLGWASISAGYSHTCAVRTDGALYCWGGNDRGQLGNGQLANGGAMVRVDIPAPVASVSAGQQRTCARTTLGVVYCWGAVWTSRENGLELTRAQTTPALVPSAPALASVSVGSFTTCGADASGIAYCWEANPRGEMGTGSLDGSTTPQTVSTDRQFVQLAAGIVQSCGITTTGAGYCWGDDTFGQLGVSPSTLVERCGTQSAVCSTRPIPILGRQRLAVISTGFGSHACGVSDRGNLYCWGLGTSGQRGDGTQRYAISTPILVQEPGAR